MLMMLKACEIRGFASTSTLTTSTAPSYFAAIFSISGATILHGPHQVAQKSTTTGFSFLRTSCSNVSSVACCRLMSGSFLPRMRTGAVQTDGGRSDALAGEVLDKSICLEDADVREAVEDGRSVPPALDEPCAPQDGEVLAHVRDLAPDLRREIADRKFSRRE